jgi:hypothetical protein
VFAIQGPKASPRGSEGLPHPTPSFRIRAWQRFQRWIDPLAIPKRRSQVVKRKRN